MALAAELKSIVQPILAARSDVVFIRRALVMTPVRHFVRRIVLERIPYRIRAYALVAPLFDRDSGRSHCLQWGQMLNGMHPSHYVQGNDHESRQELVRLILEVGLPKISQADSSEGFLSYCHSDFFPSGRPADAWSSVIPLSLTHFIAGDVETAKQTLQTSRRMPGTTDVLELMHADREASINVLHERERLTVQEHKLEKYWAPTPFPIETLATPTGSPQPRPGR